MSGYGTSPTGICSVFLNLIQPQPKPDPTGPPSVNPPFGTPKAAQDAYAHRTSEARSDVEFGRYKPPPQTGGVFIPQFHHRSGPPATPSKEFRIMSIETVSIDLGNGRTIELETGKTALLAAGARHRPSGRHHDPGHGLFGQPAPPASTSSRCKWTTASASVPPASSRAATSSAKGRPTEKEILTARMTDRPLRPLFPDGFIDDVQIMSTLLSADGENEADVLSIFGRLGGAEPVRYSVRGWRAACRVGRVKGQFIANPTHSEMTDSDLDLVYAGVPGKGDHDRRSCAELGEDDLFKAMEFADGIITTPVRRRGPVGGQGRQGQGAATNHTPFPRRPAPGGA